MGAILRPARSAPAPAPASTRTCSRRATWASVCEDKTGRRRLRHAHREPQPACEGRRRDDDEFGRRPSQADVEELIQALAVGRELDENDDLALHALEAADRFEQDLIRFVWDVLGRETVDLRL
jgi:hypothetical protein